MTRNAEEGSIIQSALSGTRRWRSAAQGLPQWQTKSFLNHLPQGKHPMPTASSAPLP